MSSNLGSCLNHESTIPGLPDDLALQCLARLSHGYHGSLQAVSKKWREVLRSSDYSNLKASEGLLGNWLFVLTEGDNNQWIAYDPEPNVWHPLPKIPRENSGWHHYGFSCVCVRGRFLVIGGSYGLHEPVYPHQRPLVTNDVMKFDPYKQQWCRVASMISPRSHFACSVVGGKVYVAGGRTSSSTKGLSSAEVYDPLVDRWEELAPMSWSQMDCIGLTYKNGFHVLNDQVGLPDQNISEVYNPSEQTWDQVEGMWPFTRAMQFAATMVGENKVYTVVDWGESSIKTRESDQGEWSNVGSVPPVNLSGHARPLEAFGYGFAALGRELYVVGGKVLKWDESGAGRFDIVKLNTVRVCDPVSVPFKWRETKPMCGLARGAVLGCATMEEE
ncbi:hypothetical protein ACHQM5_025890 [Ranunculus cassubicifolius]